MNNYVTITEKRETGNFGLAVIASRLGFFLIRVQREFGKGPSRRGISP